MARISNLAGIALIAAASAAFVASNAAAQGTATDWSGGYAGLSFESVGDADYLQFQGGAQLGAGNFDGVGLTGAFVGYNWQRGNLVYGAEFSLGASGDLSEVCSNCYFDDVQDLRGRIGYAVGPALIYAAFGVMRGSARVESDPYDLDGVTYGIGADLQVSERFFLGLELLRRDVGGEASDDPTISYDSDMQSFVLRAGLRF